MCLSNVKHQLLNPGHQEVGLGKLVFSSTSLHNWAKWTRLAHVQLWAVACLSSTASLQALKGAAPSSSPAHIPQPGCSVKSKVSRRPRLPQALSGPGSHSPCVWLPVLPRVPRGLTVSRARGVPCGHSSCHLCSQACGE